MPKEAIAGRVPERLKEQVEQYAEREDISVAEAVEHFLDSGRLLADEDSSLAAEPELRQLLQLSQEAERLSQAVYQKMAAQTLDLQEMFDRHTDLEREDIEREHLRAFAEKPYQVLPKAENEAWVVAPRFVPFNVGWLHEQNDAWNVYVVNKYIDWIEELPETMRDQVGISERFEQAEVEGSIVTFADEDERDDAWDFLGGGGEDGLLYKRVEDDKIQIKAGHEFDVIAELIEGGNLPFKRQPIDEGDLREPPSGFELRDYQDRAWDRFLDAGMIGVYWPPSAGKTYLGLYAGDRMDGPKLVVVPSNTLKEQWRDRINEFCRDADEWEVQTYQWFNYGSNLDAAQAADYVLTIFDECHHLPANTYSKLATIGTDHRIGLSASPYREDGRTEYIFALTGFPVGMNWDELVDLGVVEKPDVSVYLYSTAHRKRQDVATVVGERAGKTLIFCDSLDAGHEVASELDVPFVSGETRTGRMEILRENRVVVVSRVADEGVSLGNIKNVIEYDFHGRSRRQETQRVGRVMHGEGDEGTHIVMMTDAELEKYERRLYGLEEKGFGIRFERRA